MSIGMATEDQRLLRDQTRRALATSVNKADLRAGKAANATFIDGLWNYVAEMGWTSIVIPESSEGMGLGLTDAAILGEEFGRALLPGPYAATAIVTAFLAVQAGGEWQTDILPAISSGRMQVGLVELDALDESGPAGAVLQQLVELADTATHLLVFGPHPSGSALAYLIPTSAAGIAISTRDSIDPTCPIASVKIDVNILSHALRSEMSPEMMRRLAAIRRIMVAAELSGIAAAALDMTILYTGERKQFGVPVGSFQAIKHKLADGFVMVENARSAVQYAAQSFDENARDYGLASEAAIRTAISAALRATGDCVQVHGALGFSWEADAHLYLKRARRIIASLSPAQKRPGAIGEQLRSVARGLANELFPAQ